MILLAVDTSGHKGSLAVAEIDPGEIDQAHVLRQNQVVWVKKAMHSEIATLQLQDLLSAENLKLTDLTHIVANIGPGSFTGLRVGISLARTLAYSLNLPIIGVNSLESLTFKHASNGDTALVAVKAIQNFYYASVLKKSSNGIQQIHPPQSVTHQGLSTLANGCTKVLVEGENPSFHPENEAKDLISTLVHDQFARGFSDWRTLEPLYVRASEAEERLKAQERL